MSFIQSDFVTPTAAAAAASSSNTPTSTSSSLVFSSSSSSSSNNDASNNSSGSYQNHHHHAQQTNVASVKSSHRSNSPQIVNTTRLMAASPLATVSQQHNNHHHHQQQQQQQKHLNNNHPHHHHHHQQPQSSRPNYITINNSSLSSSSPSSSPLSFNYDLQQQSHIANTVNSNNSNSNIMGGGQTVAANNSVLCAQIVDVIRRLNIRVVAFDFDCTIVTIHTGGQWLDSPEKLVEFVRPCFRELLPCLLKCDDLYVCVVTYSPQEKLIREVLRILIEDIYKLNDLVNKIVIKGNTKEFLDRHGIEPCYTNGKQLHLEYCCSIFEKNEPEKIHNSSILLIDDDIQNIRLAENHGHYAFPVNNNMKLVDLYKYLNKPLEN